MATALPQIEGPIAGVDLLGEPSPPMREAEHHVIEDSASHACPIKNVSGLERIITGLAGGGLIGAAFGAPTKWPVRIGLSLLGGGLLARAATGYCPGYRLLGIDGAHPDNESIGVRAHHGFRFEGVVSIAKPKQEVFAFWRRLENLPRLFDHLNQVDQTDSIHSNWFARGPMDKRIEWQAEIINERPGELIAWRSIPGGDLDTAGSVHFEDAQAGRGTNVRLELKYDPPGGKAGATIAKLFGTNFEAETVEGLRRLKQLFETGEIATTAGQPHG
jgi:uncharacterized membrane protein